MDGIRSYRGVTTTNWPFHSKSRGTVKTALPPGNNGEASGVNRRFVSTETTSIGWLNRTVTVGRSGAGRPAEGISASVMLGPSSALRHTASIACARVVNEATASPFGVSTFPAIARLPVANASTNAVDATNRTGIDHRASVPRSATVEPRIHRDGNHPRGSGRREE